MKERVEGDHSRASGGAGNNRLAEAYLKVAEAGLSEEIGDGIGHGVGKLVDERPVYQLLRKSAVKLNEQYTGPMSLNLLPLCSVNPSEVDTDIHVALCRPPSTIRHPWPRHVYFRIFNASLDRPNEPSSVVCCAHHPDIRLASPLPRPFVIRGAYLLQLQGATPP